MASARDEPLSRAEQEEEEMRNELSIAGFYEENMNIEEMRELMKAVNESRITCQENVEVTLSAKESPRSSRNLSPFRKDVNSQSNSLSSEKVDGKGSFINSDDFPMLNSKSKTKNVDELTKLRPQDKKRSVESFRKTFVENTKFDPFQAIIDEPSLLQQASSSTESELSIAELVENFNEDEEDPEGFDDLVKKMSEKLGIIHEQFYEETKPKDREWGSPIKVSMKPGSATDKSSGAVDKSSDLGQSSHMSLRNTRERATKRKALSNIAAVVRDDSSGENSNDDDDEFVDTKKRKFRQAKKEEPAKKKAASPKIRKDNKELEAIDVDVAKNSPSDSELFDNTDLHSLRKSGGGAKSPQNLNVIVEDKPQYPIRVTPPIPGKKTYKGPRAVRGGKKAIFTDNNSAKNKLQKGCSDEEISKMLETIDEHIDDTDCIEITTEIKPSPVPKKVLNKIQVAQSHLLEVKNAEVQQMKNEEEAKKLRDLEAIQKKNELAKKRMADMEEKKIRDAEKEKKNQDREELYKTILNSSKTRVTRGNSKKGSRVNYEDADEDFLLGEDEEPTITHANLITKSTCPICLRLFPTDKIEEHASGCDSFSQTYDEPNNQPSTSYDSCYNCNICNNYKTYDGNSYEEHIIECKEQADIRRRGIVA